MVSNLSPPDLTDSYCHRVSATTKNSVVNSFPNLVKTELPKFVSQILKSVPKYENR